MDDECPCNSCQETRRLKAGGKCLCCDGAGRVPSILGELRPCSRCQPGGFAGWALDRLGIKCEPVEICDPAGGG